MRQRVADLGCDNVVAFCVVCAVEGRGELLRSGPDLCGLGYWNVASGAEFHDDGSRTDPDSQT